MKYLTSSVLRAIDKIKERRPDYEAEEIVCDIAAAYRIPWESLLKEYEEWLEQQQLPITSQESSGPKD